MDFKLDRNGPGPGTDVVRTDSTRLRIYTRISPFQELSEPVRHTEMGVLA
jgi:hypothetical protein